MAWTSAIAVLLSWITYPFTFLLYFVYGLLQLLVTPLLKLVSGISKLTLLPLRILARFEPLFFFFGTALISGLLLGLILHFTSDFVVELFNRSLGWSDSATERRRSKRKPPSDQSGQIAKRIASTGESSPSTKLPMGWRHDEDIKPFGNGRDLFSFTSTILEEEEYTSQDSY